MVILSKRSHDISPRFWGVKSKLYSHFSDGRKVRSFFWYPAFIWLTGLLALYPHFAAAGASFEFYGGYQTSPHSVVSGTYQTLDIDEEPTPFNFTAGWKGKSFSMPPYYGIRFTSWKSRNGWGLDFTHSKAYADRVTLKETGFELLQFTDGLNNITFHRQTMVDILTDKYVPYYGYGFGVIMPHVEFQADKAGPRTLEYQYGGPTVAINSGIKFPLKENRFVFAEYKFTVSWLDVNLVGGGDIKTRIFTNALNLGFGFEF